MAASNHSNYKMNEEILLLKIWRSIAENIFWFVLILQTDDESGDDKIFLKLRRNVRNEMKYARHQASMTYVHNLIFIPEKQDIKACRAKLLILISVLVFVQKLRSGMFWTMNLIPPAFQILA